MFNTTVEPFDDVHVRRAIAHALDKEAMANAVLFGYGGAACSIIAPTVAYHDPETPCLEHDLEAARAELAQSSVPDGFAVEFLSVLKNGCRAAEAIGVRGASDGTYTASRSSSATACGAVTGAAWLSASSR